MKLHVALLLMISAGAIGYGIARASHEPPSHEPPSHEPSTTPTPQAQDHPTPPLERPEETASVREALPAPPAVEAPAAPPPQRPYEPKVPADNFFGGGHPLPAVGEFLNSSRYNPEGLRLSRPHREELKQIIEKATNEYLALQSDLWEQGGAHAKAVIRAGGGVPVQPGVASSPPEKGMRSTSIWENGVGRVLYWRTQDVPELAALQKESELVLQQAKAQIAEFIATHGIPR